MLHSYTVEGCESNDVISEYPQTNNRLINKPNNKHDRAFPNKTGE